ncbi:MAG: Gfo/Idh/MocA family protein [Patescibacteria group bacterium]
MRKLRVGIIGTGMALEKLHYPAFQRLADRYEIAALADVDRAKAASWAQRLQLGPDRVYTDYREMLGRNDLDVVDIMVPIELNYEVTEETARRLSGRRAGIICEKPLAPTMAQAERARNLAKQYGLPIMIAENYRYNQEIDLIRDLVREKRVGDVYYFMQNRVVDFPADMIKNRFPAREWRQHPEFPGGAFTDTGVHDLAGLRHIFGAIDRVQAFGRPMASDYSPYAVLTANLRFQSGVIGQYSFFCAGREMQRPLVGLRIFGTEGMIYLEERDCGTINLALNDGRQERIPYQPQEGYYNELLNFYNALTGKEQISVTPEVEYGDLGTVAAILRSIREESITGVDDGGGYAERPEYPQPQAGQDLH